MTRAVNQAGIDLIKEFEGFSSKAYLDPVGVPTIGYGTLTGLVRRRKAEGELFNRLSVKGEGRADTGFKKPRRHVDTVFIHCSASDNSAHDDVSIIRSWHTSPPRNWSDVGYHYFIKKDGTIQPGRSLEKSPAAQYPYNKGTLAVCLHGLKEELFTEAQHASLNFLADDIEAAYKPRKIRFRGHTEVSAKTCPVIPYRKWLGLNRAGYRVDPPSMGKVEENAADTIRPIEAGSMPTLGTGDRGTSVITLQRNLRFLGRDELEPDGAFGRTTENAVEEFQWCKGLGRDGIVGSKTWEALRLAVLKKQTVV